MSRKSISNQIQSKVAPQSDEEAAHILQFAATQGDAVALDKLNEIFECFALGIAPPGIAEEKSYEKAIYWLTKIAELGAPKDQFLLGICILIGNTLDLSRLLAASERRKADTNISGYANVIRSFLFDAGRFSVVVDIEYDEAVMQQLLRACRVCFLQGNLEGWTEDELLEQVIQVWEPLTLNQLAHKMEVAVPLLLPPQSYANGLMWISRSAEQGFEPAKELLGFLEVKNSVGIHETDTSSVSDSEINDRMWLLQSDREYPIIFQKAAVRVIKAAAESGHGFAQLELADLYRSGRWGLPQSERDCFLWELRAAKQGHQIEVIIRRDADAARKLAQAEKEKRETVENMMAMFAHKFRGPVDSILFNTTHHHDERIYVDAARTMNGLLDIFSVVSTTPEKLANSLKDDVGGNGSPATVLLHSLKLALVQLLSTRNRLRMSPHYLAYAKRQGQAPAELRQTEWMREKCWVDKEIELQTQWEQEIGTMNINTDIQVLGAWMASHLLPIRVEGFVESTARFAEYGPRASLLTVIFTEVLVNAIKHTAPTAMLPMVASWTELPEEVSFTFANPSTRASRDREKSKGSGRGHKFLNLIAEHIGGRFIADISSDKSWVSMTMPSNLMTGDDL